MRCYAHVSRFRSHGSTFPRSRALALGLIWIGLGGAFFACPPALAQTKDGDALVVVNNGVITRKELVDLLLESHGLAAMQQLIVLDLARQETKRRGIKVGQADVDAEFRQALDKIAPPTDASGVPMTEENKRKALDIMLEQKGISFAEFMIGMERNAHLRKIAEQSFQVSEATLREEFARTNGEKVVVRHIQLSDNREVSEALGLLAKGADFADVAKRLSRNANTGPNGGEMPPFTFVDPAIPPVLREAAFSLNKPGEMSNPIRVEKWYHILRLEKRLPPENVRFEDVRAQVEVRLRDRVLTQKMNELAVELFQNAKIRVLDPKLKPKFDELLKRNAASGQP